MQILGDVLVSGLLLFLGYKVFLKFGIWAEKRGEKIINETKKGAKNGR